MELRPSTETERNEPSLPTADAQVLLDAGELGRGASVSARPSSLRPGSARPAARRPASSQVVDILKEAIRAGRLEGGARLDQLKLADQLGVSRTPVREAFYILEAEGWIARTQYRHAVVLGRDRDSLRDQLDLTRIVYSAILAKAARAGKAERADLADLADIARARALRRRPAAFALANQEFLDGAVVAARSSRFAQASRIVGSGHFQGYFERTPEAIEVQQEGLDAISVAIRSGDPDAARTAMNDTCAAHLRHLIGE
jgi:DNA-binding GntR family transcriptional regulator